MHERITIFSSEHKNMMFLLIIVDGVGDKTWKFSSSLRYIAHFMKLWWNRNYFYFFVSYANVKFILRNFFPIFLKINFHKISSTFEFINLILFMQCNSFQFVLSSLHTIELKISLDSSNLLNIYTEMKNSFRWIGRNKNLIECLLQFSFSPMSFSLSTTI